MFVSIKELIINILGILLYWVCKLVFCLPMFIFILMPLQAVDML